MIGWGAMGCLLEWASLPDWESGSLSVVTGAFSNRYSGAQSAARCPWFSASVALLQGPAPVALGRTQQLS